MKYIRTKDGIYDLTIKNNDGSFNIQVVDYVSKKSYGGKSGRELLVPKTSIIAQANTIEELCDELVVHNPSNDGNFYPKHFVYQNKWENMLKPLSDYQKSKGIEIYGAIWTDKGLIYVAKMNEKGDLKLL